MSNTGSNNVSLTFCAVIGLLVGAFVTGLLMVVGDWRFLSAAFVGAIFFALAFFLIPWWFMKSDENSVPYGAPVTGNEAGSAPSAADSAAKVAPPAPVAPAPTVPASSASSSSSAASAGAGAAGSAAASAAPAAASASPAVKPSTPLPGEAELASKKGEWKYEGGADAKPKAAATPKAEPAAAVEGPGEKPATLSAARDGGPDDLKQIKGVGPKMEKMLHGMGFYHFDQIASWTANEVAWVDQNLEGFKGRVTRDTWVDQAKLLAAGGETEFSKKVDKGGVY